MNRPLGSKEEYGQENKKTEKMKVRHRKEVQYYQDQSPILLSGPRCLRLSAVAPDPPFSSPQRKS